MATCGSLAGRMVGSSGSCRGCLKSLLAQGGCLGALICSKGLIQICCTGQPSPCTDFVGPPPHQSKQPELFAILRQHWSPGALPVGVSVRLEGIVWGQPRQIWRSRGAVRVHVSDSLTTWDVEEGLCCSGPWGRDIVTVAWDARKP